MGRSSSAMTRRLWIGQLAAMAAWAQSDDDPLHQLRAAHPRLILLDSDLDRLKVLIRENPLAHRIYLDPRKRNPTACLRLRSLGIQAAGVGPRLRAQTRKVLDRVSTLALMYRLTLARTLGYLRRAVSELRAAANFRDWNPAIFADTAEMAHAFALGYDWLYEFALARRARAGFATPSLPMGRMDPVIPIYKREGGWPLQRPLQREHDL